jgi:hypothetical protein
VECHLGELLRDLLAKAEGIRGAHRDPMARFLVDRRRRQKPAGRPDEAMTASTAGCKRPEWIEASREASLQERMERRACDGWTG